MDLWKKLAGFLGGSGIRRRLQLWGLGLFALALSIVVTAGYFYMLRQIREDASALQSELAAINGDRIRAFVQRKIDRFSDTAKAISLYPLASAEQRLLMDVLVKNDNSFTEASIIDAQGMEVVKVSDRKVYFSSDLNDQSQTPKFIQALKGEIYLSRVYTSRRAQPYVTLGIPLWGGAQSVVGVVAAEADLSFLWEAIGKIQFGKAGYAYLVDERGNLIGHKDAALVLKGPDLRQIDGVQKFLRNPTRPDSTPASEGKGLAGVRVLSTYAPVPVLGWAVVVEEPADTALASVETLKHTALLFLLVGLFVGAVIISWVSRKITRPIQELQRGVATIGAGNLEHRAEISTGDEIEELAREFNKMTEALQNSRATLEQKVQQRTAEISALYRITTAVNESLALNDILNAVMPKTREIFQFECIRVFLCSDEDSDLELQASYAADPELITSVQTNKRGQSIVGRVADSGEPIIFEDIRTDPRYAQLSTTRAARNVNLRFLAVFPIKTQARIFGVIFFAARSPRKLSDDEMRLLTSMSEHLAVAVEKANLYRESEKRAQQLSVLNTIGEAVSRSLNLNTVLNAAIDKMIDTLNFDASWIYLHDPAREELDLRAYKGIDDATARKVIKPNLSLGIDAKMLAAGQKSGHQEFHDHLGDQRLDSPNESHPLPFASAARFPIKAKDKVLGVLFVANKVQRHFSPDELQLIDSIAQAVGVASENARLFEQVNQKTAELRQINEELQEANRAKSEFITAMSHELRTPLNVIMGNAELAGEGFFGEVTPEQIKAMKQIRHHSQFLLKLVNDVLALSRLDAKKMSLETAPVDLEEVIAHVQSYTDQANRLNRVEVSWKVEPNLPQIVTDGTKLREILQNLLGNALKFTPRGRIEVQVKNLPETGQVEFSVADTGIGIEPADLTRIFDAFEQIKEAHTGDFNGVGLGLNIVKKYLELMNGDIKVESHPGEGSKFTFSVPHFTPLHS